MQNIKLKLFNKQNEVLTLVREANYENQELKIHIIEEVREPVG